MRLEFFFVDGGIVMFIVYSPEGQNSMGAAPLLPQLRVDPAKKVVSVGESSLDQLHTELDKQAVNQKPLQAYRRSMKHKSERKKLLRAGELMVQPVIFVEEDWAIGRVWALMQQAQVHHFPVLQQGRLIGLLTLHDILLCSIINSEGQIELTRAETVADIMQSQVVTTHPSMDIRRVADVMAQWRLGCMPIMSQQQELVGMITLSDIVKALAVDPPLELYV